jgi:hypothetical protein
MAHPMFVSTAAAMTNPRLRRFARLHGDAHRLHVQQWFERVRCALT